MLQIKKIFLVCLFFECCLPDSFRQAAAQGLPKILPPSPEAASLFRFLDYAVDYSSGMPQVSIPLYEVKSGSLRVPVSISYFAGGRRANDVTGPVGLGWSLNAGGMISRTIYGKPDDQAGFPSTLKPSYSMSNQLDYDYLASLYYKGGSTYDSEYDVFSYSAGAWSGKFLAQSSGGAVVYKQMPLKPVKIINPSGAVYPSIILDDKGNEYKFGVDEQGEVQDTYYGNPITGKLLTSIISADKNDTISFTYIAKSQRSYSETDQYTLTDWDTRGSSSNYSTTYAVNSSYRQYAIQRIAEIKFRGGKVTFVLHPSSDRIKTIQVWNDNNALIRNIELRSSQLDQPSYTGIQPTYKLDSVLFQTGAMATVEKYGFEYNTSSDFSAKDRDFWGFINWPDGRNTIMVPKWYDIHVLYGQFGNTVSSYINIPGGSLSGADRSPNTTAAQGVLKKITYPTGGSTEFTYENNQYYDNGSIKTGGGLRVAQIKSNDNNGNSFYKTYKYGYGELGYGVYRYNRVLIEDLSSEKRHFTGMDNSSFLTTESFRKRVYSSEFLTEIADKAGLPVYYEQVTEYDGTLANNKGKTVYTYDVPPDIMSVTSYPVPVFPYTTPYPYQYLDFSQFTSDSQIPRRHIYSWYPWKTTELRTTDIYRNNGNNTYTILKKISNVYKRTETETVRGTHIYKFLEFSASENTDIYNTTTERMGAMEMNLPVFQFDDYTISIGRQELESVSEVHYTPDGEFGQGTTYTYNSKSLPVNIQTISSKGEEFNTQIKYPVDFVSDPAIGAISQSMEAINMLNYPIEETRLKGTTLLSSTKNLYRNWSVTSTPKIAPEILQEKQGAASYENRVRFFGYDDRSNVVGVSKEGDVRMTYLWGYNKLYPIAEAVNAQASDIFHTSFEETEGNSNEGDARTGRRSRTAGYSKSLTGLTNGAYVLSYWQKSGGNWVFQMNVVNVVNGTYTISLSGQVDEIRFHPASAQMITFTYDPLVGMTSRCDISGIITFYEYDDYGRLRCIRDKDKMILKTFDYQYQGQP